MNKQEKKIAQTIESLADDIVDFTCRLVEEVQLGDTGAVVAEIRGSAHITGVHEFIVDPRDPFQEGYLL